MPGIVDRVSFAKHLAHIIAEINAITHFVKAMAVPSLHSLPCSPSTQASRSTPISSTVTG